MWDQGQNKAAQQSISISSTESQLIPSVSYGAGLKAYELWKNEIAKILGLEVFNPDQTKRAFTVITLAKNVP